MRLGTTIGIYFLGIVLQYVNHFSAFFTQTGTCLVPWWDFQACLDRFLQKCSIHGFIQVEDLIFKKIAGVHTDVPSDRKANSLSKLINSLIMLKFINLFIYVTNYEEKDKPFTFYEMIRALKWMFLMHLWSFECISIERTSLKTRML